MNNDGENKKNSPSRVAVCLITDNQDNILMGCRNDCGKYTCPAGHIESGEEPHFGAIRELKEETGLDAQSCKLVLVEKHDACNNTEVRKLHKKRI